LVWVINMDLYQRKTNAQKEINNIIRNMQPSTKITYNRLLMELTEHYGLDEKFLDKTLKMFLKDGTILIYDQDIIERQ